MPELPQHPWAMAPGQRTYEWPPKRSDQRDRPFFPRDADPRSLQAFDQALGRGYRIGDATPIPALAGMSTTGPAPVVLTNHGTPDRIGRWKATLMVKDPAGNDIVRSGAGLQFVTIAAMENEIIPRTCFVTIDDAQVIYAPGRSINIMVNNPNAFDLVAHWNIDEVTAGLASWEDRQELVDIVAETDLVFPPFCDLFEVYSITGGGAPLLTGYGPGGVVLYTEALPVPRSPTLRRIPGVDYTITPTAAPETHIVLYICDG